MTDLPAALPRTVDKSHDHKEEENFCQTLEQLAIQLDLVYIA